MKTGRAREVEAIRGTPPLCPCPQTLPPSEPWHLLQPRASNTTFPFCASPGETFPEVSCPRTARGSAVRAAMGKSANAVASATYLQIISTFILCPLARLRVNVHQRWLSAFDDIERAANCGTKFLGIGNRTLRVHAQSLRKFCVVDTRVVDGGADSRAIHAAAVAIGHDLHLHHLLMIGAIVVHDGQQRNAVMRRGPQNAGCVHQVPVALDVHGNAAVLFVGQGRADRGRRAVADSVSARGTDELVILIKIPKFHGPAADELNR